MPAAQNIIKSCFKATLMWVMLLWALTLPGQEVQVYQFLFNATTEKADSQAKAPVNGYHSTFQEQAVQAFVDAKPSSCLVSLPQQAFAHLPFAVFAFAKPVDDALPVDTLHFTLVGALAQIFAVILQPNAP